MGVWRNISRLANLGAVQGVVEPGPTDVLTPAQLVQIGDDVSHTISPVVVPVAYYQAEAPIVVANFSIVQIRAAPRGTRFFPGGGMTATGIAGNITLDISTTDGLTILNPVILAPALFGGVANLHRVTAGDVAAAPAPNGIARFIAHDNSMWDSYFVPGGTVLNVVGVSINAFIGFTMTLQDVP